MTSDTVAARSAPARNTATGPPPGRRPGRRAPRLKLPAYIILALATLVILGPFVLTLLASLRPNEEYITSTSLWPSQWSLTNYVKVFTEIPMGRMIYNGLFIAILATLGNLLASLVAAFCLAKLRFPGRSQLFGVTLFTMLIPSAVTLIPLYTIIRAVGLVDSPWALIVPFWTGSAFSVFFLRQHLLGIPHEMFEAAVLDGCSVPATIFRIFLPSLRGPLSILAILNFLASWNDLLGPLIYLNSPEKMTPTVGLTYFQGQYTTNFPVVLAGALVILIPTTIIFLIFNRQLRQGMLISGLK